MEDEHISIYRPLSFSRREIRLLTVHSDLRNGLVAGGLETVSLLEKDYQYHAISWRWGDATKRKPVVVNGKVLKLPENADAVLRNVVLRHGYTGKIWIDAICINQSDIEERASQVSIMREVYTQATKVLIWLGDDEGHAAAAINSVQKLVEHCRGSTNDLANYESITWMRAGKRTPRRWFSYGPLPDGLDWSAIRHLYGSPLLCRVWVIQEISLANDPICFYGHHSFPWREIGIASEWMIHRSYERSEYCGVFVRGIMNGAIICSARRSRRDMDKLLMTSAHFDCSEPRDKVFGLLDLTAQSEGMSRFTPDYKADVREIFIAATRTAIATSQRLHLLGSAQIARSRDKTVDGLVLLPSWVPQYALAWKRGPKGIRNFCERGADNGSALVWDNPPSEQFVTSIHAPLEVLRVKGLEVAEIVAAFGPMDVEMMTDRGRMADLVQKMTSLINELNPSASSSELLYRAFTAHEKKDDFLEDRRYVGEPHFEAFLDECGQLAPLAKENHAFPVDTRAAAGSSSVFLDHLKIEALHCSFFITADGRAGRSSSLPVAGDVVCILFGSEIPLILRPVNEAYNLIGGAYLADIMDGSSVAKMQQENTLDAAARWFDIV